MRELRCCVDGWIGLEGEVYQGLCAAIMLVIVAVHKEAEAGVMLARSKDWPEE
tara:strand:- start:269 stop:427 length:159 start_codon:yes stop_codon:yes gene_type:complete